MYYGVANLTRTLNNYSTHVGYCQVVHLIITVHMLAIAKWDSLLSQGANPTTRGSQDNISFLKNTKQH